MNTLEVASSRESGSSGYALQSNLELRAGRGRKKGKLCFTQQVKAHGLISGFNHSERSLPTPLHLGMFLDETPADPQAPLKILPLGLFPASMLRAAQATNSLPFPMFVVCLFSPLCGSRLWL